MSRIEYLFDNRIAKQKDQLIQRQEELIDSLQASIKQRDEKLKQVIGVIDDLIINPNPDTTPLFLAKLSQILKS